MSLRNTVVYEGTLNMMLSCAAGPNGSAWSVVPTSSLSAPYQITNFGGVLSSNLTELYAIDQKGLIVRNGTTTPTGGPVPTAGIYIVQFPGSAYMIQAKVCVIRK